MEPVGALVAGRSGIAIVVSSTPVRSRPGRPWARRRRCRRRRPWRPGRTATRRASAGHARAARCGPSRERAFPAGRAARGVRRAIRSRLVRRCHPFPVPASVDSRPTLCDCVKAPRWRQLSTLIINRFDAPGGFHGRRWSMCWGSRAVQDVAYVLITLALFVVLALVVRESRATVNAINLAGLIIGGLVDRLPGRGPDLSGALLMYHDRRRRLRALAGGLPRARLPLLRRLHVRGRQRNPALPGGAAALPAGRCQPGGEQTWAVYARSVSRFLGCSPSYSCTASSGCRASCRSPWASHGCRRIRVGTPRSAS